MEGSIYERSEIAEESSVGSCNDCSDLSHSIQDLQLGKEKRTSSNQIQKEEVDSYDTQFKKRLEKSAAAIEIMKDEQAIPPEDLWAYHTNIDAGYTLPSNMHSDQESFTGSTNSINQYSSYREPNNFLGKKASTSSVYGGPSISGLVNQYIEIQSVLRNPTNVYASMRDYNPRMDQIASANHYEFESTGSSRNYSGNSYSFPNTIGSSRSLWNQQGVNLGHWNTLRFSQKDPTWFGELRRKIVPRAWRGFLNIRIPRLLSWYLRSFLSLYSSS
ncbi:Embryonic polyadenylate-binding protein [Actinidia chinensis var. chinensis]|uniref:Embryonic polyadenylate-binding protein n=1 Tax=Actinidia chinensis var. chinensis TaxID=1590841 RepID=A0A2R6Q9T2_ACTCC|nr:Embryonic polyadenylate-binding protein [Actinidia chinensis var. chinensis]